MVLLGPRPRRQGRRGAVRGHLHGWPIDGEGRWGGGEERWGEGEEGFLRASPPKAGVEGFSVLCPSGRKWFLSARVYRKVEKSLFFYSFFSLCVLYFDCP